MSSAVQPHISIIIPVYNKEAYIDRCLSSILKQTYTSFECIIIDDGSTDKSYEICKKYSEMDSRIRILQQKNKGPSSARNKGLAEVISPWVTFVDADDYLIPSYLENFSKYLSDDIYTQIIQGYYCYGYKGENIDTLYPGTIYLYNEIEIGNQTQYVEENNLLYDWAVWCKIFSAKLIRDNELHFEESLFVGEDGLFWHHYLCLIKKIIFIPERGYIYFCPRQFNSISRNAKISQKEYFVLAKNYKSITKGLLKNFRFNRKYSNFINMLYLNNYFHFLASGDLSEENFNEMQEIRPSRTKIIFTARGLLFWVLNLFPTKAVHKLLTVYNKYHHLQP